MERIKPNEFEFNIILLWNSLHARQFYWLGYFSVIALNRVRYIYNSVLCWLEMMAHKNNKIRMRFDRVFWNDFFVFIWFIERCSRSHRSAIIVTQISFKFQSLHVCAFIFSHLAYFLYVQVTGTTYTTHSLPPSILSV